MRILVKIDKSRALKLGSDITSDQVVEILADSLKDKEIFLDSSLSFEERKIADFKFKIQVAIATQEEVLREISSTLEDKAVKIEKAIELFLSQKDEEKISDVESLLFDAEIVFPKLNFSYPLDSYRYFEKNISKTDEKVLAECERLQKICDEINVKKTLERKERKEKEEKERAERKEKEEKEREEIKEREEREEKGKEDQLKNIVSLLGTDLQKEKFAAGLMRRKEIISLLFNDIFKEVIEKFEVFENEDKDEYDNVSTKATLSDEQFAKFLEIKKYCSSCSFSFHHAYNDEDDDCLNDDCLDYVKIVNQIGYLTLECRVKL